MTGATRDALIVQRFTTGDDHFTVRRAPGDYDALLLKTEDGSQLPVLKFCQKILEKVFVRSVYSDGFKTFTFVPVLLIMTKYFSKLKRRSFLLH